MRRATKAARETFHLLCKSLEQEEQVHMLQQSIHNALMQLLALNFHHFLYDDERTTHHTT